MKIPDVPFSWKLPARLILAAIAIWVLYLVVAKIVFCTWQEGGVFGDTFGALSSLFSVLAFAGVLFSLLQDRKERSKSARIEAYDALLRSIEHQLRAAEQSGADELVIGDLLAKQRLYSEELETLITGMRTEPLLNDEQVADAFSKIPWFKRDEILSRAREIRKRLLLSSIVTPNAVSALVENAEIRTVLSDLYVSELERDPKTPFDPDALAVWGGHFIRRGITEDTKNQVRSALKKSTEWRNKYSRG